MALSLKINEAHGVIYDFEYTRKHTASLSPPPSAPVDPPILVRDLLKIKVNRTLVTIRPTETVFDAVKKMKAPPISGGYASLPKNSSQIAIRTLLVMDENNKLVGICGQGDITKVLLKSLPAAMTPVSAVMTPNPVCVFENDELKTCVKLLLKLHIRHMPVRNKDNVVTGMISKWDIIDFIRSANGLKRASEVQLKDLPPENELKSLITVKPTDTILAALKTMNAVPWPNGCPRPRGATTYRIRSLPVFTHSGDIAGMVTQGDFLKCFLNSIKVTEPVSKIMTPRVNLVYVRDTDSVARCFNLVSHHRIRKMLVKTQKQTIMPMQSNSFTSCPIPPVPKGSAQNNQSNSGAPQPPVQPSDAVGIYAFKGLCTFASFFDFGATEWLCAETNPEVPPV
jgi:CBS domain-containing protein